MSYQWVDVWARAIASGCTFCLFLGGRGIGKTYGALKGHKTLYANNECGKLVYMRLTGAEIDGAATPEENPYKRLNYDTGDNVEFISNGKAKGYTIAHVERDENGTILNTTTIGTGRSLSSFHNLRGVDFYDYDWIYFDEFIPAESTRRTPEIKRAGYLFSQAYETINRNRELLGQEPVKVIMTANAFSLDSDILRKFDLIKTIQRMQEKGQKRYTDRERSIYVELCEAPDIAEAKAQTALYKAMGNTKLHNMALKNQFDDYSLSLIKDVQINDYRAIIQYNGADCGTITIYRHKSTGELYAAARRDDCKDIFSVKTASILVKRWRHIFKACVIDRTIYFDNADTYYTLSTLFNV